MKYNKTKKKNFSLYGGKRKSFKKRLKSFKKGIKNKFKRKKTNLEKINARTKKHIKKRKESQRKLQKLKRSEKKRQKRTQKKQEKEDKRTQKKQDKKYKTEQIKQEKEYRKTRRKNIQNDYKGQLKNFKENSKGLSKSSKKKQHQIFAEEKKHALKSVHQSKKEHKLSRLQNDNKSRGYFKNKWRSHKKSKLEKKYIKGEQKLSNINNKISRKHGALSTYKSINSNKTITSKQKKKDRKKYKTQYDTDKKEQQDSYSKKNKSSNKLSSQNQHPQSFKKKKKSNTIKFLGKLSKYSGKTLGKTLKGTVKGSYNLLKETGEALGEYSPYQQNKSENSSKNQQSSQPVQPQVQPLLRNNINTNKSNKYKIKKIGKKDIDEINDLIDKDKKLTNKTINIILQKSPSYIITSIGRYIEEDLNNKAQFIQIFTKKLPDTIKNTRMELNEQESKMIIKRYKDYLQDKYYALNIKISVSPENNHSKQILEFALEHHAFFEKATDNCTNCSYSYKPKLNLNLPNTTESNV